MPIAAIPAVVPIDETARGGVRLVAPPLPRLWDLRPMPFMPTLPPRLFPVRSAG